MLLDKGGAVEREAEKTASRNNLEEGGTDGKVTMELQTFAASRQEQALKTDGLMEVILEKSNLKKAYKRVYANKGSAGVDGMTVYELEEWLGKNENMIIQKLMDGTYQPQPVRKVEIPIQIQVMGLDQGRTLIRRL